MAFTLPSFTFGDLSPNNGVRLPQFLFGEYSPNAGVALPAFQFGTFSTTTGVSLPTFWFGENGPIEYSVTASGGVYAGGAAYIAGDPLVFSSSGGVRVSGAATIGGYYVTSITAFGRGGVRVTGTAPSSHNYHVASGGVRISGLAGVTSTIAPVFVGALAGTIPRLTSGITGTIAAAGVFDAALSVLSGSITGAVGVVCNIDAVLPTPTSSFSGGVQSFAPTLPLLNGAITGAVGAAGSIDASLPLTTGAISGTVGATGGVSGSLSVLSGGIYASHGVSGAFDATLPAITGVITGSAGVGGGITATIGVISAELTGYLAYSGSVSATIAPLAAYFTGVAGLAGSWHVVAMNLKTSAITEYQGYPFNSMVEFNGRMIGASANGLFFLDGATDNGVQIASSITTSKTDFGAKSMKRLTDAYLSGQSTLPVTLTVSVDDDAFEYEVPVDNADFMRQHKANLGRGMKSRYYQFTASNTGGATMEIDALEVIAEVYSRRV